MARYETIIESPMSQQDAFDFMADMRNFDEWDPGIKSSKQLDGLGPEVGASYRIKMSAMTLRYETTELVAPARTVFESREKLLSSFDTIEVTATANGSSVRYEAVIELNGPLKLIDPLFALVFNRIGDKAAAGMAEALNGTKVS